MSMLNRETVDGRPFTIADRSTRMATVRGSLGFFNRIVVCLDGLAIAAISAALLLSRDGSSVLTSVEASLLAIVITPLGMITMLAAMSSYRIEHYRHLRRSLFDLLCGSATAAALFLLLVHRGRGETLTLSYALSVSATMLLGLAAERLFVRQLYGSLHRRAYFRRRVAIIGDNLAGERLAEHIRARADDQEFELVGLFSEGFAPSDTAGPKIPSVVELRRTAHQQHIDLIVLALPWAQAERIFDIATRIQWISADIVIPVDTSRFMPDNVVRVAGRDMLLLASHPLRGSQGMVKLVEDYLIASLALLLVLPVMLLAAMLIALANDGPILFRQLRMGVNGQPFHIYKFRTMAVSLDDDGSVAVGRGDPRVTPIGSFLRRTSLDELPQLFNVLKGEMSIVGPRPHVPGMLVEGTVYSDLVQTYAARHRLKPGITGWAQVNGMRAGITSEAVARKGVELDLFYVRNWSLKLDLDILVRTLTRNMVGRHIY